MAEDKDWLILRLFEPTGKSRKTQVSVPFLNLDFGLSMSAFEIKTIAVDLASKETFELDLMERKLKKQGALFFTD
jgi:alpha-mannosidase